MLTPSGHKYKYGTIDCLLFIGVENLKTLYNNYNMVGWRDFGVRLSVTGSLYTLYSIQRTAVALHSTAAALHSNCTAQQLHCTATALHSSCTTHKLHCTATAQHSINFGYSNVHVLKKHLVIRFFTRTHLFLPYLTHKFCIVVVITPQLSAGQSR